MSDDTADQIARAVAAERARCAARVRDAYPTGALKSTPTLRAVAAALDNAVRGIESGDTGADGDVVMTAIARLTRDLDEARAAIAADLHCDECDEVATRHHHEPARKHGGDDCACDAHSAENSDGYWIDLPHAAAVRAAKVTP